jgi:hypothetical protein
MGRLKWVLKKMDGGIVSIDLAQESDRRRAVMNAVINVWV